MRRRALVSVSDKRGVVDFARGIAQHGFDVLSTGGTLRVLQEGGVRAQDVSDYTGFPELMGGRLKTLHPRVHGGILARRTHPGDLEALARHGIDHIDLVAVNLYPFEAAAARPNATRDEVIENIDIGGPSMLRAAAKNHADVCIVVDPADYAVVLEALAGHGGQVPAELRRRLAGKAFACSAAYDVAIAEWFDGERRREVGEAVLPASFALAGARVRALRYGENPHQAAAFYRAGNAGGPSLAAADQLCGKELSYNNLLDLDAALRVVAEHEEPACAVVKHTNPCGAAVARGASEAFAWALAGDPMSAFGGIVALNRPLDAETARLMVEKGVFIEAVAAPDVHAAAVDELARARWGEAVRVLSLGGLPQDGGRYELRQVSGGFLLQEPDPITRGAIDFKTASERVPTAAEMLVLDFAWRVAKHVHSNAIVLAASPVPGVVSTVGIGAGQMSRIDSVRIAVEKAGARARGAVLASDAFFPFADGIEVALAAGVTAIAQPGGSRRDAEVLQAVDRRGAAMVFTGRRHFRH
jgi:phosphoribosylaminoimidazolecarboxamide formyltransferase/IMP cyclohydrolase